MDGFVGWPEALARSYREHGYWEGITIGDALARSIELHHDRVAIVDGARRVTYGELGPMVERISRHLLARGLGLGSTIVFQLPNSLEFVVAYFACLRVGAIPICALPHHRHTEIRALAQLAEAQAWFGAAEIGSFDYLGMMRELAPDIPTLREVWCVRPAGAPATASFDDLLARDPVGTVSGAPPQSSDIAALLLSGGTTGIPKLIARTHDDYRYNSLAFARATSLGSDDVLLLPIPIAHNFPLACPGLQGALLLGGRVVLAPSPAPDVVFPLIARERVTWIPAVPATVIRWTEDPRRASHDLSSIRHIYVGGQRLNAEPARAAIAAFGHVIRQVYGMAEGLLCCTGDADGPDAHLHTQGRAMSPGDELRVVGDDGEPVAPGELGELECRGPYTICGYFRAAEHNKQAISPDGFYRTGDVVRIEPDGSVVVEGRKKDLINRGGEKISAEEIENLLMAHPAVVNAAVVAMPDRVLGERACACVVAGPGQTVTLAELVAFLQSQNLARFKLPERLELFDQLPLTGVGKVAKKELRVLVAERLSKEARVTGG